MMFDWNRNGKIDPVDVGISLAFVQEKTEITKDYPAEKSYSDEFAPVVASRFAARNSKVKRGRTK